MVWDFIFPGKSEVETYDAIKQFAKLMTVRSNYSRGSEEPKDFIEEDQLKGLTDEEVYFIKSKKLGEILATWLDDGGVIKKDDFIELPKIFKQIGYSENLGKSKNTYDIRYHVNPRIF